MTSVAKRLCACGCGKFVCGPVAEYKKGHKPVDLCFWSKVVCSTDRNGCWTWTGAFGLNGYGHFAVKRKSQCAHRVAWILTNGPIPDHLDCCHHCDEPSCVNPAHLFLGTRTDNMQDMVRKGRQGPTNHPERMARGERHGSRLHPETVRRGELNGRAVINEDLVRQIRVLGAQEGRSRTEIARQIGCSRGIVYKVFLGLAWKHVE